MFDHTRIKEAFANLVGLRQNDNPAFGTLSDSLLYNGDNVLVNHPLINIENLEMCARNYGKFVFPAYVPATTYTAGERVTVDGVHYESLQGDNVGHTPATSPTWWKVLNLLDLFLLDVWATAAEDTVNEVFLKKKLNQQTKTLLSSLRFFEGVGNFNDLIVNEGSLVGVQVKLLYSNNILAVLEQIGIQLTVPNPELKFYIFHSSQKEPLAILTKNHTKTGSFQWHDINAKLNYLAEDHDAGGVFFIMYDQDQLLGQAIRKQYNFHVPPCAYCSYTNVANFNLYSKYMLMNSVRVKAADRDGLNMWDITKTQYTPDTNWGLNFQFTVKCDLTDFIIRQKDVFKYAMRDMVTKKLLEVMANTTRQNVAQAKIDVLARNELMSSYSGGMGFMKQLEDQLKGVNFEMSNLDDVCMPCGKKGGIGYGTASLSGGR